MLFSWFSRSFKLFLGPLFIFWYYLKLISLFVGSIVFLNRIKNLEPLDRFGSCFDLNFAEIVLQPFLRNTSRPLVNTIWNFRKKHAGEKDEVKMPK